MLADKKTITSHNFRIRFIKEVRCGLRRVGSYETRMESEAQAARPAVLQNKRLPLFSLIIFENAREFARSPNRI